jgi:hypothetical protein
MSLVYSLHWGINGNKILQETLFQVHMWLLRCSILFHIVFVNFQ